MASIACGSSSMTWSWLQGLPVIAGVGAEDEQQCEREACQGEGLRVVVAGDVGCTQGLQVCVVQPHHYPNQDHKQDRWPVPGQHLQAAGAQPLGETRHHVSVSVPADGRRLTIWKDLYMNGMKRPIAQIMWLPQVAYHAQ